MIISHEMQTHLRLPLHCSAAAALTAELTPSAAKYTSPELVGGVIFPLWRLRVSAKLPKRSVQTEPILQSINPNHRRTHRARRRAEELTD